MRRWLPGADPGGSRSAASRRSISGAATPTPEADRGGRHGILRASRCSGQGRRRDRSPLRRLEGTYWLACFPVGAPAAAPPWPRAGPWHPLGSEGMACLRRSGAAPCRPLLRHRPAAGLPGPARLDWPVHASGDATAPCPLAAVRRDQPSSGAWSTGCGFQAAAPAGKGGPADLGRGLTHTHFGLVLGCPPSPAPGSAAWVFGPGQFRL